MALTRDDIAAGRGRDLGATDGSKLGRIQEIYLDTETNEPECTGRRPEPDRQITARSERTGGVIARFSRDH